MCENCKKLQNRIDLLNKIVDNQLTIIDTLKKNVSKPKTKLRLLYKKQD